MNRVDIQELRVHVSGPALTIITKNDTTFLLKRLTSFIDTIRSDYPEFAHADKQLEELLSGIKIPASASNLAFFMSKNLARLYPVCSQEYPYPSDIDDVERIDHVFYVDSIVRALNRQNRYFVIACTPEKLRFYEGYDNQLAEIIDTKTGKTWSEVYGKINMQDPSLCYKQLDEHLDRYIEQEALPLLVIQNKKDELAGFSQYSKYSAQVCAYVDQERDCAREANRCYEQRYNEIFDKIDHKDGSVLLDMSPHYGKIAEAAIEGRIASLVVSRFVVKPGCREHISGTYHAGGTCSINAEQVDIIDEIIETVKAKRGNVTMAEPYKLEKYNNMVALTRF